MRSRDTGKGYSTIVSNEEYRLLKKIDARKYIPVLDLDEFYQELGENLYSKSLLNKVTKNGIDYFVALKRN
ncbi:virion structural protein [Xanthomonas phage XaC1]|nr:virion structural protein [Xanthomonas phage XaC1]